MNYNRSISVIAIILLVLIIHAQHRVGYAQKDIQRAQPNKTKPTSKPTVKPQPPKLATLQLINADPAMRIEIDNQQIANKDLRWENDSTLTIKAKQGTRVLKVTRDGYLPFSKSIDFTPTKTASLAVTMIKLQASLIVKSLPGTRISINDQEQGVIAADGQLTIDNLDVGEKYQISSTNDDYQPYKTSVVIKESDNAVEVKLTALPTSEEFLDTFENGLSFWNAPAQWQVDNKKLLHVSGAQLGMPKEKRYCDAHIRFGLRLNNNRGAAWALKAKDSENYYLFVLSGPESSAPNRFQTFICRKGKYEPASYPVQLPDSVPLKPGESFAVSITMADGEICHQLTPNSTGEDISIGYFKPPKNSPACGNVGFIAPNNEDFFIYEFVITPNVKESCAHQSK